jgi:hypothetical protein
MDPTAALALARIRRLRRSKKPIGAGGGEA